MPKAPRTRSTSNFYNHLAPNTQYTPLASSSRTMPAHQQYQYSPQPMSLQTSMSQQSYASASGPSAYQTQGGPVQPHMGQTHHQQQYSMPVSAPPPVSLRPSSGAWSPADDQTLMNARAQGMNWAPIQQAYFLTKTPNACRKRHERLMERRNADDWDGLKLENMARHYIAMRREIWSPLAAQTGEKWTVVEQKCMSQGLKNLQTAARSHARRERLDPSGASSLQTPIATGSGSYTSTFDHTEGDSGYADEVGEAEYHAHNDQDDSSDRSSNGMGGGGGGGGGYYGHSHSHSNASNMGVSMGGGDPRNYGRLPTLDMGMGNAHVHGRLPSVDMGIEAIIHRPSDGR